MDLMDLIEGWVCFLKETTDKLGQPICERGKVPGTYTMLGEFDGRVIRLDGCMDGLAISKDKRTH
jgi:hypothetical protein